MKTLTVLSGLPGAGKSTHAARMAAGSCAIILARDAVRTTLAPLDCEWTLTLSLLAIARVLLQSGHNVIIDAPNLHPADRAIWAGLAAETDAVLNWVHIGTPLEECVRRDAQRPNGIGEAAVREHAAQAAMAA